MSDSRPVALVTGGARRIGAAIARRLHADGYDLALHHFASGEAAATLAAELDMHRPGSTRVLAADLRQPARIPELVARTIDHFTRLDALVNNASAYYPTPFGTVTPAQWDELFAINARAPFLLAQAAAPHLAQRNGAIVNLVDAYAERPRPGIGAHAASKAALAGVTRALAVELAPRVRVNGIAPGAILWPEDGIDPALQAQLLARTPLARAGSVEEVAEAVRWLLRDAGYLTGEILRLDGGRGGLG
ncbi:pteridine reductase [Lysobacter pythonis]|uniref:Pteridine reductase n=1 Tax=Solilutibacter pythonis TaxID=2483112 RepID=A0A3M2HQ39_9GAMM|nr:pteridine reductase [Lysobacter pythonis]RMH89032.1 pteridine reductase [Lysobacter pythonis]